MSSNSGRRACKTTCSSPVSSSRMCIISSAVSTLECITDSYLVADVAQHVGVALKGMCAPIGQMERASR